VSNPDTLDITPSPEVASAPIYRHWRRLQQPASNPRSEFRGPPLVLCPSSHPSIKCAHDAHDEAIGASHGHRRKSPMTQQIPLCAIISEDA
jgi:hypothetical protein